MSDSLDCNLSIKLLRPWDFYEQNPCQKPSKIRTMYGVGGNQGFLLSHEQLLTECVGGDNVKCSTQNHRFFFTPKRLLWYTCQLTATFSWYAFHSFAVWRKF